VKLFKLTKSRLAAGTLLLSVACVAPAAELELLGYSLGAPLGSVNSDANFDCGRPALRGFGTTCYARAPQRFAIGAAPLTFFALHYESDKLAAVEARMSELRHKEAVKALTGAFGEAKTEPEKLRAGMGGVFENAIYIWQQGGALLRLEQFFRNINTSSAILTTEPQLGKLVIPKPTNAHTGIKDL
jgi:hypothetical protein